MSAPIDVVRLASLGGTSASLSELHNVPTLPTNLAPVGRYLEDSCPFDLMILCMLYLTLSGSDLPVQIGELKLLKAKQGPAKTCPCVSGKSSQDCAPGMLLADISKPLATAARNPRNMNTFPTRWLCLQMLSPLNKSHCFPFAAWVPTPKTRAHPLRKKGDPSASAPLPRRKAYLLQHP